MELIKKEALSSRFMGRKGSWPGLTLRGGMAALVALPRGPAGDALDRAALPSAPGRPRSVMLKYELFQHIGLLRGF